MRSKMIGSFIVMISLATIGIAAQTFKTNETQQINIVKQGKTLVSYNQQHDLIEISDEASRNTVLCIAGVKVEGGQLWIGSTTFSTGSAPTVRIKEDGNPRVCKTIGDWMR